LEKNSGFGGDATNFRNQAQTCTGLVHIINQLISIINRLMF